TTDGSYVTGAETSPGSYAFFLAPGTYLVRTDTPTWSFDTGLVDQLWQGKPCGPQCDVTTGTPLSITAGQISAVDFALQAGVSMMGRVSQVGGGTPSSGFVIVATPANVEVAQSPIDASGRWRVDGLAPGTYVAFTDVDTDANQLWDAVSCGATCDASAGTPIQVGAQNVTGVDFDLVRLGQISGSVHAADTHGPLWGQVRVRDLAGTIERAVDIGYDGTWLAGGLPAGSYHVWTDLGALVDYRDEAWQGAPCESAWSCTAGLASATTITVTDDQIVSGVDFSLARLGHITGNVAFVGGAPVPGAHVVSGSSVGGDAELTDSYGQYELKAVYPGDDYWAMVDDTYNFGARFASQ